MADFSFNASAGFGSRHGEDEDGFLTVQLAEVPKSRAPSFVSSTRQSLYADDSTESLIKHGRSMSYSRDKELSPIIQEVSRSPTEQKNWERRNKLQGWKFGVTVAGWTAFSVMVLNLLFLIVGLAKFHDNITGGVGTLFDGSCSTVDTWTTWLHILINGFSSILLSASNYTMQCLASPTRGEIDRAHSKGDWLDIGVASVRNILGRVSKRRIFLWWVLAASSIPIHLLYNSAIFKTMDANNYAIIVGNEAFLEGKPFAVKTHGNTTGFDYRGAYPHWWDNTWGVSNGYGYGYGSDHNYGYPHGYERKRPRIEEIQSWFAANHHNANKVDKLSKQKCINAYGSDFISNRDDVIVITNHRGKAENQTFFGYAKTGMTAYQVTYFWMCPWENEECDLSSVKKESENLHINGYPIDYCLSRKAEPHCKLQFSVFVMVAVIIMNACKTGAMFWTMWRQREVTLVTCGDALASFLETPDEFTKGRCLMGKADINRGPLSWRAEAIRRTSTTSSMRSSNSWTQSWRNQAIKAKRWLTTTTFALTSIVAKGDVTNGLQSWRERVVNKPNTTPPAQTNYAPPRRRLFAAASAKRWLSTASMMLIALGSAIFLLWLGVSYVGSTSTAFAMQFGAIDSRTLLTMISLPQTGQSGLVCAVLLANTPQAICSFIYLAYNGLFTSMCLAAEWSRYYLRPKPLRVTTPRGKQRSTYYLHLPYRFSVPLLITSASLHWLISESFFMARIDFWSDGQPTGHGESLVGYSCTPILLVILLGFFMLFTAIGVGSRKFASSMPVAGSCSVAISAACHKPKEDVDAAFLAVSWGATAPRDLDSKEEVGHCCFTTEETFALVPGRLYAGEVRQRNDSKYTGTDPIS